MSNNLEHTLWVTSIQPEKINGYSYVPSALYYDDSGNIKYGQDALNELTKENVVNTNFKIDLGDVIPGGSIDNRKGFQSADNKKRSAFEFSKDYINSLLKNIENKLPDLEKVNFQYPAKVLIAEPLSFQIEGRHKDWIKNYRKNIKRILNNYESIEFLPEPFAVYQYYKYGLRIPHLQEQTKKIAFIIDFGGGTFDACLIESTRKGDISLSGKNSKPLSADSIPVGGYFVNTEIAKYLMVRNLDSANKKKAFTYIKQFNRLKKGEIELNMLRDEAQMFIKNLKKLEIECEKYKVGLSSIITSWLLTSDSYEKIIVKVPKDPFSDTYWIDCEFAAHQFRKIFIEKVWNNKLKTTVKNVFERANESLYGKNISITLISGGSSNIGWLQHLLMRDFSDFLDKAEPVPIHHSFQEIVANGLAIECARRHFSSESEFVAVTYNPIKLFLDPDLHGIEREIKFKSIEDKIDMSSAKPGDLIPSAQPLKYFFDMDLQWKFKLKKPPKRHLNYYFTRPDSFDEDDYYNVEETRVHTKDKHFDQSIIVNLVVREDGTVVPKFIYKSENKKYLIEENSVSGKPFFIDMTSDSESFNNTNYYIGFDFGTSNSSICTLTNEQISLTAKRQENDVWQGLSKCINNLPFPVAIAVRKFLSTRDINLIPSVARETFESCLAFMAYCAASEAASLGKLGNIMNGFAHRSLGPLKQILKMSLDAMGESSQFSSEFKILFNQYNNKFNQAIDDFNNHKHDKLSGENINWQEYVELLVKILSKSFIKQSFGYCSTCNQVPFQVNKYEGIFVFAHDNAPFVDTTKYHSSIAIDSSLAILYDKENHKALSMTPFVFWWPREHYNFSHGCFWLDKMDKDGPLVKPCDEKTVEFANNLSPHLVSAVNNLFDNGVTVAEIIELEVFDD